MAGKVVTLGKTERAAHNLLQFQHADRKRLRAENSIRLHAVATDSQHHHHFGWPVLGAHFAFWSSHRMIEQAVLSQARLADLSASRRKPSALRWGGTSNLRILRRHYSRWAPSPARVLAEATSSEAWLPMCQ